MSAPSKGGRPLTGCPNWNPDAKRWEARVQLASGQRKVVPMADIPRCERTEGKPEKGCDCGSCERARRMAKLAAERAKKLGGVPTHTAETANEWFGRYVKLHAALGRQTTQHLGDWERYVAPFIGTKPLSQVTADDVRAIRDNLTKLRLEGKIGAKRACNVWSDEIKAPFSRAFTDDDPKYGSVRVGPFAANPALGLKPPASSSDKEQDERDRQALDPAEGLALLSCASVPADLRRFYAFAMYTGLRPAETYGLLWSDVRLDAARPVIKVQRGRDMKTAEEKATKTKQSVRDVPIHPHLRPMLTAMRDAVRNPAARVFNVPEDRVRDVERAVGLLRRQLAEAGIDREELTKGTPLLVPFDVRSFRTTFATWCAKAGYDSAWVSTWLGHKPKGTAAKHYVKDTPAFEDVRLKRVLPGVVPPFPPLPAALNEVAVGFGEVLEFRLPAGSDSEELECEGRDLNPYRSYPTGT